MHAPVPASAGSAARAARYAELRLVIDALLEGEDDWVAGLATVATELHQAFAYFHWTGFYRLTTPTLLVIGPYQGGHGCTRIALERGVCGAAARERRTLVVPDVHAFPDHIACSSTTRSEVVVPIFAPSGNLLGVLDVDSDDPDAFTDADRVGLETLAPLVGARFPNPWRTP